MSKINFWNKYKKYVQVVKSLLVGLRMQNKAAKVHQNQYIFRTINRKAAQGYTDIPKTVWIYWESLENMPPYISNIIDHNQKINPDYKFNILEDNTYKDYLPFLNVTNDMPIANKADIIRLALLHEYGGVWLDATVILQKGLEWITQLTDNIKYDIIAYYREKDTVDFDYPIIENWFLAAEPNNPFIANWLQELTKIEILGAKDYWQSIQKRPDFRNICQNIPHPSYLLAYIAGQIAYRANPNYNAFLKRAEDSALLLEEFYPDNYSINYAICRLENPLKNLELIKLTSGHRMFVNEYIQLGLVKKHSLIGQFN